MNNKPEFGVMTLISVNDIQPHPDNPRKDVGDVSELAESIKANGVLQNLTVVPIYGNLTGDWIGKYTVVIGHRRLAAAKLAGLEKVPCVVSNMSGIAQIRTMLTENIQRSDLTPYEQAQGFQMMIDLGDTVDEIAERAGFSKTTVRRRVKLLELDKDKFKKAEKRGATLQDYIELDKINDLARKNEVLDAIGTSNFRDRLKRALEEEALARRMAEWEAAIATFAVKIEKQGYIGETQCTMDYWRNYGSWTRTSEEVEIPADVDTVKYFYRVSELQISVYKEHQEHVESEEDVKRRLRREKEDRLLAELEATSARHYALREEFIRDFTGAKRHFSAICKLACVAIIGTGGYCRYDVSPEVLDKLLSLNVDDEIGYSEFSALIEKKAGESPEYTLLATTYALLDNEERNYWTRIWNSDEQTYQYIHSENATLDRLYGVLTELGYEMSDDEQLMMSGEHPLLKGEAALDELEE